MKEQEKQQIERIYQQKESNNETQNTDTIFVPNSNLVVKPEVPEVEWWDEFLLPEGKD